ncbi:MAG: carbohydrate kinase [Muribaculaceae bacterium]
MKNQVIVGIGEALWDVLPEGRKLGGAPANFAYHVSQFGLDSYIVSAVGDDALGKEIISNFKEKKLNHIVDTVPYPTGTVQVELDPQGVPQYEIKENVAWDNIPFTPQLEALAHRTRAVCWGSLAQRSEVSRTTIMRFIDSTSDDCLRVFDINLRQNFYSREVIEESMRRCSVLKINDEELVIVSRLLQLPGIDVREKCRGLMELFGMKMVVLTCGVNGSYVLTAEEESFCPTPRVEVADTVGAGDSFTGSFVAGLLEGKTMRQAHERAVNVSAFVCTQAGAMPVIPSDLK